MKITDYSPRSGRMIKEDGTVVNIADLLAGEADAVSGDTYNIDSFSAQSGRMIREDGSIINIADMIASGQIPGGGETGGTSNYNDLTNKPSMNGTEIKGALTGEDVGLIDRNQGAENAGKVLGISDDGNVIPMEAGGGSASAVTTQVDHGTADTTFALPPNQYHTWGEVASLTLTLGAETSGQANGYWFSFDSGDTATTLSLPETVKTDIVVEPNMHYECSIVGNYMTFEEWGVSA